MNSKQTAELRIEQMLYRRLHPAASGTIFTPFTVEILSALAVLGVALAVRQ